MAEFVQALDPAILLQLGTGLAFISTPFAGGPTYNFPLFLFGLYAHESVDAVLALQTFTALLGVSALFDIFWMFTTEQAALMLILTIFVFLLKIPMFLSFGAALRQRGRGNFGGLGVGGNDLNGPPVWSMPGGFSSQGRDGYQSVDEENPPPAPFKMPTPQPAAAPTASVQSLSNLPPLPQASSPAPVSYQAAS